MGSKNQIDKLFNDRFASLELNPEVDAWPGIQERIARASRRKKAMIWRWTGTAAAVILAFFSGFYWQSETLNDQYPEQLIHQSQSTEAATGEKNFSGNEDREMNKSMAGIKGTSPSNQHIKTTDPLTNKNEETLASLGSIKPQETIKSSSEVAQNYFLNVLTSSEMTDKSDAFILAEPFVETAHDTSQSLPTMANRRINKDPQPNLPSNNEILNLGYDQLQGISVGISASPTIAFNSVNINDQADVASQNIDNDKVTSSFTAGVDVGYRGRHRWALETGLYINQWTQNNDRLVARAVESSPVSTVSIYSNNSTGNLKFENLGQAYENFATNQDGLLLIPNLTESYTFLEIPITAAYYLIEKPRWNWKIRGGLSSRFLTASSVNLSFEDGSKEAVENLPLNNFSLQLLLGTGVEYRLNPKLRLNLTPSVQYGLTPVNQHDVVDTYFHQFLIYSGLSYML